MKYAIPVKSQFSACTGVLRGSPFVAHSQFTARCLFPSDAPSSPGTDTGRANLGTGVEAKVDGGTSYSCRFRSQSTTAQDSEATFGVMAAEMPNERTEPINSRRTRLHSVFYYGMKLEFRPRRDRCQRPALTLAVRIISSSSLSSPPLLLFSFRPSRFQFR